MKHLSARWRVQLLLILHVKRTFWPVILHPVMDVTAAIQLITEEDLTTSVLTVK